MEPKTEAEKAAEEYGDSLSQLTIAKNEINALTMVAEDNKDYAIQIAACIEDRLRTAPSKQKLPILYLMDSICKNFPQSKYVELFTQNIVSNFCNVYKESSEKTRMSLNKLRMTWKDTKTFPEAKLHAIDVRVNKIEKEGHILNRIPVNEVQAKQKKLDQAQQSNQQSVSAEEDTIKSTGTRNRQPKRAAKKVRINTNGELTPGNQINQVNQPAPTPLVDGIANIQPQTQLLLPGQQPITPLAMYPTPMQTTNQLPTTQPQAFDGLYQLQPQYQATQPVFTPQPLQPIHLQPITQNPSLANVDQGPFINTTNFPQAISQNFPQQPQQSTVDNRHNLHGRPTLPNDLDLTLDSLYGGKQCSNCSLRFDDNNKYAIHLDWHYRQNKKSDKIVRRKWYYPLDLWVQFREINDEEIQASTNSDSNNVNDLISQNDHEVPTAPASKEDAKNICSVCHETFEKFWAEEEEEWRLRNARLHDDGTVYHPPCLMDMLQAKQDQE